MSIHLLYRFVGYAETVSNVKIKVVTFVRISLVLLHHRVSLSYFYSSLNQLLVKEIAVLLHPI